MRNPDLNIQCLRPRENHARTCSHQRLARSPQIACFQKPPASFFEIHPPQRRFKWKNQQVEDLWKDILNAHKNNCESYFLGRGTLLLVPLSDGRVSVIDGQQRLATISILLAVLRDHCKDYPDLAARANGIQRLISRVDNDGNPVGSLVVTLQEPDNQLYIDIVKQPESTASDSSKRGLLSAAVKKLRDNVTEHINVPNAQEHLRGLCEYVQTRIMFLPLEVRSEGEGYLVFDTTNTRGIRLSPSEALKGRLATTAREDNELSVELITRWNTAAKKLEDAELPIDAMDDYLHAIWCSRKGYTTKRALERVASSLIKTDDLKDFVKDLDSYCVSYLAVVAPAGKSLLTEDLKDLRGLNVQSNSFLTMVHKHSFRRFREAVDLVLSLQIRNVTVGPHQANEYEKDWPGWAMAVRKGDTDKAFGEIRRRMESDEDFRRRFGKESVASAGTVRHLLRRLDPISRPGSGVQPIDVDVEHVLPKSVVTKLTGGKNLTKNVRQWIEDLGYHIPTTSGGMSSLGKELEALLNRLGNQALLNDRANRGAKDLPFSKKKDVYKKQALELTKTLAENEDWGLSQISARQEEMAKSVHLIWPK